MACRGASSPSLRLCPSASISAPIALAYFMQNLCKNTFHKRKEEGRRARRGPGPRTLCAPLAARHSSDIGIAGSAGGRCAGPGGTHPLCPTSELAEAHSRVQLNDNLAPPSASIFPFWRLPFFP